MVRADGDRESRARKIYVIGGAGSGKTTLARRLSEGLSVPRYELDTGADQEAVLASDTWIVDGVYLWHIEPVLGRADLVVWLDLPRRVCRRRILARHIRLSVKRQNPHKGLRLLARFLRTQREYYEARLPRAPTGPDDWTAVTRVETARVLDACSDKVIHLTSARAVDEWAGGFLEP